jgi:hypothetical protein
VIYEFGSIVSFVSTRSVLLISESGNEIISIFLRQDKYMFRWCHDFLEKMRDSYNGEFFLAYLGCTLGSTGYVILVCQHGDCLKYCDLQSVVTERSYVHYSSLSH